MTHKIDFDRLTVLAVDSDGKPHDLNATGEPCQSPDDLLDFIAELYVQGAFGSDTRRALSAEVRRAEWAAVHGA